MQKSIYSLFSYNSDGILKLKKLNLKKHKKLTDEEDLDKEVDHYLNTGRIRRDHQKVTRSLFH